MSRHRSVPVSWDELLRLRDRQLRRVIADRYQATAQAERVERAPSSGRLPVVVRRALAVEVARLEAQAEGIYERMLVDYQARIRQGASVRQGPGQRVAPLDEFVTLVARGESAEMALHRLGTNAGALSKAAYRHGRRDVLELLGIRPLGQTSSSGEPVAS